MKRAKNLNTKTNERPSTSTNCSALINSLNKSYYEQTLSRETDNDQTESSPISGVNFSDEMKQSEKSITDATSNVDTIRENDERNENDIPAQIENTETTVEQQSIDEDIIPASPNSSTKHTAVRLLKKNTSGQKKITEFF